MSYERERNGTSRSSKKEKKSKLWRRMKKLFRWKTVTKAVKAVKQMLNGDKSSDPSTSKTHPLMLSVQHHTAQARSQVSSHPWATLAFILFLLYFFTHSSSSSTTTTSTSSKAVTSSSWLPFSSSSSSAKSTQFTIISLMRDMNPELQEKDLPTFAFQWNALSSWLALVVPQNVIVFMDTQPACDWTTSQRPFRGIQCYIVPCWNEEYHRPSLDCIFNTAHQKSHSEVIAYVNGDIVLSQSTRNSIEHVIANYQKFVVVSRRTDTLIKPPEYVETWSDPDNYKKVLEHSQAVGELHSDYGIDLFAYPRSIFPPNFPAFLAGVYRWDNWLLSEMILREDVTVIDATKLGQVVHQELGKVGHGARKGAPWNDRLVKERSGTNYKLGHMFNSDMNLVGECPQCTIEANRNASHDVLFTKRANPDGWLAVLTVNYGYMPLAYNWLCWARRIKFSNFIFLAEDLKSGRELRARGVSVITPATAVEVKPAAEYGSTEFQETMSFRTNFLMKVLKAGFHFMTADLDGVWLDDPFKYMNPELDLQGQAHKEVVISGGLVAVRSTTYGQYFWKQVIECQEQNAQFLATHEKGTYEPSKYTEQECINDLSRVLEKGGKFKRGLLDPYLFPDGKSFFDEKNSQMRGVAPVLIHNNWIVGMKNKLKRLEAWDLLAVDSRTNQCLPPVVQQFSPPTTEKTDQFTLIIRILTMTRHASLKRLLTSLINAKYLGDKIELQISIDYLPQKDLDSPDPTDRQGWAAVKEIAHSCAWPHGPMKVIEQPKNIGLTGQWTQSWFPTSDTEIILIIEDDMAVVPDYYIWLKKMIITYYLDPAQYDPRMFGITLQNQHTILGESPQHRYGSRHTSSLVGNHTLYRYQLLGTWGTIMFPQHWREFTTWIEQVGFRYPDGTSLTFQPCVPTILANKWWAAKPRNVWSQWFVRFAFEKGWYSLYTNFYNRSSLIINHREGGLNFQETRGPMNPWVEKVTEEHLYTPPLQEVPLFDFHFNRITNAEVLEWRRIFVGEKYFDQCWTVDMLSNVMKERREKKEAEEALKKKKKEAEKKEREKKAKEEKERLAAEKKAQKEAEKEAKAKADEEAKKAKKEADKEKEKEKKKKPKKKKEEDEEAPAEEENKSEEASSEEGGDKSEEEDEKPKKKAKKKEKTEEEESSE